MNIFEMEKEFNDLIKHGQELIEKLKQEKEPVKEVTEEDVGKLCEFWDGDHKGHAISTLERLQPGEFTYKATYGAGWKHCRRLTPTEVAEITGYKVEEK